MEVLENMEAYKQEFINFMVESDVLKFGEFTLKSGRKSPFFMNAGAYVTGTQLRRLGQYYAKAIHDHYGLEFDVLFGPAYKGIPLSVATANGHQRAVRSGCPLLLQPERGEGPRRYGNPSGKQTEGRRPGGDHRGCNHLREIHRGRRFPF